MKARSDRPRAVFDCNALLQALISEAGPASQALVLMEKCQFDLYLSRPIFKELRSVLHYPRVRERNPNLTDEQIEAFLEQLRFRASTVQRLPRVFRYPRARQDEPYLDLAAAVKADFLVTRDADLLSLRTGHDAFARRFRQITRPLRIVDPAEFLTAIVTSRKP